MFFERGLYVLKLCKKGNNEICKTNKNKHEIKMKNVCEWHSKPNVGDDLACTLHCSVKMNK